MFVPGKLVPASKPTSDPPAPDIIDFVERRLGFQPDPLQRLILTSCTNRVIINCTRQWGKTTVSVAKAIYLAWHLPDSLIVVASPGLRQSGEWMHCARGMLDALDQPRGGGGSIRFDNGSRIVGVPDVENRIRGFSASMVIIDEAARFTDRTYYKGLRPMLSVRNGDLWMLSTPNGKRGFFYDTWERGGPAWTRVSVPATECPRISKEFLDEQRSVLDDESFRQEHMCEFLGSGDALFDPDLVEAAFDDDLDPV